MQMNGYGNFNVWQNRNGKKKFTVRRLIFFLGDVNIKKVLISNKISFGKKTINTLLVTGTIIMKLSHYI